MHSDLGLPPSLPLHLTDWRFGNDEALLRWLQELHLVELGVFSDEVLEIVDDDAGVVGRGGRGEEGGDTASAALARCGVGLTVSAGAFVEVGRVDYGGEGGIEGWERGERKGVKFRVGESGCVYGS